MNWLRRRSNDGDQTLSYQKDALLADINKDIPQDVDWRAGAKSYVQRNFDIAGVDATVNYMMTKPHCFLPSDEATLEVALTDNIQYLNNFFNTVKLLKLPAGAKFLDVACGAGWMSHYARKFGYETYGFDISEDFIRYARERLRRDKGLQLSEDVIHNSFGVHDIEVDRLSERHAKRYDAVVLESCLHHFINPISALSNLAETLSDRGVIVIIEGENRSGSIKPEYVREMLAFHTLERPYSERQLQDCLRLAGLPYYERIGELNGFFSPNDPIWGDVQSRFRETVNYKNLTVCSRSFGALKRVFPFLIDERG